MGSVIWVEFADDLFLLMGLSIPFSFGHGVFWWKLRVLIRS